MIDLYNPNNQKLIDLTARVEKYRELAFLAKSYAEKMDELDNMLCEIEETEEELAEICRDEKEQESIQKRIDYLEEENMFSDQDLLWADEQREMYEKLLAPIEKEYLHERTEELRKLVYTINDYNSKKSGLFDDTKTLPIINDFYYSDYDFLLLRSIGYTNPFTYIVIRDIEDINHYDMSPSISDLKKGEDSNLGDLTRCIRAVEQKFKANKRQRVFAFDKPCPLRAQTYDDRTGFYGKQYGETKDFLIIGISYS